MLKDYLASLFGEDSVTEEPVPDVSLPLLYTTYTYESFRICGKQFIFFHWTDRVTLRQYTVRKEHLEARFGLPVILLLQDTFEAQLRDLIGHRVMFVVDGSMLFMPFAGLPCMAESTQ